MRYFRKTIASLSVAAAMALSMPFAAFADGQRVLTLGVDLSDAQKNAVISYCGANLDADEVVWVNNQQERDLLSSWVPIEQIGSHTYSCAYVRPTTSGGIQVKTANLTWVTATMIASSMATSGVSNCEVIAVSPFPVSGTGALTGVLLAYENATATKLDTQKQQLAAQEMVTTAQVANSIGQVQAAELVNDIKIQIVNEKKESNDVDVQKIVNEAVEKAVAEQNKKNEQALAQQKEMDDQEKQAIAEELAKQTQIAEDVKKQLVDMGNTMTQQEYDWNQMSETLKSIDESIKAEKETTTPAGVEEQNSPAQENVPQLESENAQSESGNAEQSVPQAEQGQEALPEDSILINTNESALEAPVETATNQEAVQNQPEESVPAEPAEAPFEIIVENTETTTVPENQDQPDIQFGNEQETVIMPEDNTAQNEQPADLVPVIQESEEEEQEQQPEVQETSEIAQEITQPVQEISDPTQEISESAQEIEMPVEEVQTPEAVVAETEVTIPEQETAAEEIATEVPETEIQEITELVQEPEPATEAVIEGPQDSALNNLWSTDYPETVLELLNQKKIIYPAGDDFDMNRIIPLPFEGKWALIENDRIVEIYNSYTDENGNLRLEAGSLNSGSIEKISGTDGFYKIALNDGSAMYYKLCSDGSGYTFAETDENGVFTGNALFLQNGIVNETVEEIQTE